ncbi:hypothetical protein ElyMa_005425500 [Elysia marginata]|uniref:Uncharacterized protein n=1 Tax=Elysia marginata TaxID=1093978 RepID=A0AAV4EKH6_9GAST|nr:hypothetical protein ElyMa_005425500 [Elysia marginata]
MVTIRKLKNSPLKEFKMLISEATLWRKVKRQGFTFKKICENRRVMREGADLQATRCLYLSEVLTLKTQGWNLVYLKKRGSSAFTSLTMGGCLLVAGP